MKKIIISAISILLFLAGQSVLAADPSLSFSSASGNYTVGQKFNLTVYVQPNGATYDTVATDINFPADKLQVTNVSLDPVFSTASPDNSFDNSGGTISYGAGIPGGTDQPETFATITFNVISAGNATVSFANSSAIINGGDELTTGLGTSQTFTLADAKTIQNPPKQTAPTDQNKKPVTTKNPVKTPTLQPSPTQANPNLAGLAPAAVPVVNNAINNSTKAFGGQNIFATVGWVILLILILFAAFVVFMIIKRKHIPSKKTTHI